MIAKTERLGQAKRMLFWLISRPDVATPPALLAFPGAYNTPAASKAFAASIVEGMLVPSQCVVNFKKNSDDCTN